jgi:hypothetical protein
VLRRPASAGLTAHRHRRPGRLARLGHETLRIVRFRQVPPGRLFCPRSRRTGDVAVVKVIDTDDGDYGTMAAIDCHERGHRPGASPATAPRSSVTRSSTTG